MRIRKWHQNHTRHCSSWYLWGNSGPNRITEETVACNDLGKGEDKEGTKVKWETNGQVLTRCQNVLPVGNHLFSKMWVSHSTTSVSNHTCPRLLIQQCLYLYQRPGLCCPCGYFVEFVLCSVVLCFCATTKAKKWFCHLKPRIRKTTTCFYHANWPDLNLVSWIMRRAILILCCRDDVNEWCEMR